MTFPEVFATLDRNPGIDAANTTVTDAKGRPHYLVEDGELPISGLT